MKANELRIWNWVNDPIHNKCNIELNKYTFSAFILDWRNDLKPIPLTEEWLLKFGFRTEESSCFELDNIQINTSRELMWINTKCKYNIEIGMPDYIHQLQNLYFSLTNTEL